MGTRSEPNEVMGDVRVPAHAPACRFCATPLRHVFVDLGMSPLCQRHVRPHELGGESHGGLHVALADAELLVHHGRVVDEHATWTARRSALTHEVHLATEHPLGVLLGIADGGRGHDEDGRRAVKASDADEATQKVRQV